MSKKDKYQVVGIHPFPDCNMKCMLCYRKNKEYDPVTMKSEQWWLDLVPDLASITYQVAMGGGESMLNQDFVTDFSEACKANGLIFNVTTNGTVPMHPDVFKNIEMLSVSLDRYKYPGSEGFKRYLDTTRELSKHVRVGCNLLVEDWMLKDYKIFVGVINRLYTYGKVERIFALLPKKWPAPDILRHKKLFLALTAIYEHFYVDDVTKMIITEGKYSNWKHPCHYGRGMVSINEYGQVTGCSFSDEILMTIDRPIHSNLKEALQRIKIKKRYSCPYLLRTISDKPEAKKT
jgi:MoaA/NifB/PqqE/SkfB family radical SAM enzyme